MYREAKLLASPELSHTLIVGVYPYYFVEHTHRCHATSPAPRWLNYDMRDNPSSHII